MVGLFFGLLLRLLLFKLMYLLVVLFVINNIYEYGNMKKKNFFF